MNSPDTISGIADAILYRHPAKKSLFLGLGDLIIQVKSNSPVLLDELRLYFKEFISWESHADIQIYALEADGEDFPYDFQKKEPDHGKTRIKEEYIDLADGRIVRKRLTGMVLLFNGRLNMAIGPCLKNSNQIVNFINNRFIEWMLRRDSLLAHASGVCLGNRGLALAGFSGSGKSTLALHLLNQGASFVSNDRLMIRRQKQGIVMYGIPKHPRVNPGTLLSIDKLIRVMSEEHRETFSRFNPDDLWSLEYKYDVIIHEYFGEKKFLLRAPMNGLLILNWQRTDAPLAIHRVDMASRQDLLAAFMKSPGLFFQPESRAALPDFSPGQYLDMLGSSIVYEATGGVNFQQATSFCLGFLKPKEDEEANESAA